MTDQGLTLRDAAALRSFLLSRDGLAATIAMAATAAAVLCFSLDMYGGAPGFGPNQIRLIQLSGGLYLLAFLVRYLWAGQATQALRFAFIAAQVLLLALVLNRYQILDQAFHDFILGLAVAGFLGNHFLPRVLRPTFFLLLSLAGMFGVLGPVGGLVMLVAGLAIVGICHLPIGLDLRIALLLVVAVFFGLVQVNPGDWPVLAIVLPILPSIFMFRLVIYLYDTRHGKGPQDWPSRLAYFFMLPNFVFPFFPVVDFAQWGRSYNARPEMETYQDGARWILFGTIHLILYRFVNYYLSTDPTAVDGFGEFLFYTITNFALYLKVSGLFHLILGLLHLFGWHLPETHSRYYLSFSFIEFWRRINIYWKDFMQKLVFNPVFAWSKARGIAHMNAIILAIAAVFFVTWATHAYQWFWLRGGLFLNLPDTLFWGILGLMLIIQTVEESRPPKKDARALIGPMALRVIRTVAMMLFVTILWAMWSSESWADWTGLLAAAGFTLLDPFAEVTPRAVAQSAAFAAFLFVLAAISAGYTFGLAPRGAHPVKRSLPRKAPPPPAFGAVGFMAIGTAAALLVLTLPQARAPLDRPVQEFVLDMQRARLSTLDQERLERGYYENLTGVSLTNSELWNYQAKVPADWIPLEESAIARPIDDYRGYGLRPSASIIHKGVILSTNSRAQRDIEYPLAKPQGTVRIALLGASRALGEGVEMEDGFVEILERDLARELGLPVEIINFAVGGYDGFQKLVTLEKDVGAFAPDFIFLVTHENDITPSFKLSDRVGKAPMPYDFMQAALDSAGVQPGMPPAEIERRLAPHVPDLADGLYRQFGLLARDLGAEPVVIYLPSTALRGGENTYLDLIRVAVSRAGLGMIDLEGIYAGYPIEQLRLAPWDNHPNRLGHRVIAEQILARVRDGALRGRLIAAAGE